jgi:hypothetical protein
MATLTIKISDSDLAMLGRIAVTQDRRIQDLAQVLFADGLSFHFCEEMVHIKKEEDELTEEQKEQIKVNRELIRNDYFKLTKEEQAKTAFKDVEDSWKNWGPANGEAYGFDNLIDPMAERIRRFAID